jgi:hypothetical protein
MNMDTQLLHSLTDAGARLPWIKKWLTEEVWSIARYENENMSPLDYLMQGEDAVNKFESLISSSADRVYDELMSPPDPNKHLLNCLADNQTAVVVFDGLSLRELPIILRLADDSGLAVSDIDCSLAAVPSDTLEYIKREFNLTNVSPSTLQQRKELKEKNITVSYTVHPEDSAGSGEPGKAFLIWSAFPDNTYNDSGARLDHHFAQMYIRLETAWMNTVQQIRGKSRIIITSDHGYIFFGTGMDSIRTQPEMRELNDYFGNHRFAYLSEKPDYPKSDDVYVDTIRQVAMLKGRVKTRSTGDASSKLYKHGGLSLMEMLTPWVVLNTNGL